MKKVAFLVDFDNVATDVIEQALQMAFKDYEAVHIRRAYCNAEQAQTHQSFLKRLGLRAIVNLAIGKNSTDIAMAVDAMDLAIAERPDVIVLVSSDSDFAPLVLRLREKGAWLRGFGQYGKTGDGVIQIYDQFNELAHSAGRGAREASAAKTTSGRGRRGQAARPTAGRTPAEPVRAAAAVRPVELPPAPVAEHDMAAAAAPAAAEPRDTKGRRRTAAKPDAPRAAETAPKPAPAPVPAAAPAAASAKGAAPAAKAAARTAAKPAAAAEDKSVAAAREINAMLAALPKLADGQWHDLGAAAKVLKEAGLMAKSAPSTKLFRKHPHAFELQPEKTPNQVRFGHG